MKAKRVLQAIRRNIGKLIIVVVMTAGLIAKTTVAQTCTNSQRVVSIQRVGTGQIGLTWQSASNRSYYVQSYTNLAESFPFFSTLATVSGFGSQTSYTDAPPSGVKVEFYRILDASSSLPCVSILSPTNGATVSGLLNVGFSATALEKITSGTLIVDGQATWTVTSNNSLPFPSYFFSNGVHTVTVQATDDGFDQSQGIATSTISVNVQNNITFTWYEAFTSTLPIQATLAYQNASYTIQIKDASLNLLKTLTGSTANGVINTSWDGTNSNGVQVADDSLYFITLSTTPTPGPALAAIPPPSGGDTITAGAFYERQFTTAQTILAREKLANIQWDPVSQSKCDAINTSISGSPSHQDIYGGGTQKMITASDWQNLLTAFKATSTRNTQFYFTGHANGTAIGLGPGLQSIDVEVALNNLYYIDAVTHLPVASFKFPYKFVFIDGCLSGTGDWMRSFAINNSMDYSTVGRKNRAFLGWGSLQVEWFFTTSNGYYQFATKFWDDWVSDDTVPLTTAINTAFTQASGVDPNKLVVRGFNSLQWSD